MLRKGKYICPKFAVKAGEKSNEGYSLSLLRGLKQSGAPIVGNGKEMRFDFDNFKWKRTYDIEKEHYIYEWRLK